MSKSMDKLPEKVLCMTAGDMQVCMDVKNIIKVILLPYLERCPSATQGLIGMLNYAGQSICVMDLYSLLSGLRKAPYHIDSSIVIVENDKIITGFLVDAIDEIRKINSDDIQDVEKFDNKSSMIYASIIFDEQLHYLLRFDLDKYQHQQMSEEIDNTRS